jgi:hypothetical protein
MKGVPNAGIPQRLPRCSLLLEHKVLGSFSLAAGLVAVARRQISNTENPPTPFGFGPVQILAPQTLFDLDGSGIEIHVFPFQAQNFRNSCAGRNAGLNDQEIGLLQAGEDASGFFKAQNAALILIPFLSELGPCRWIRMRTDPQAMTLGIVKDTAHNAAHPMHRPPGFEGCVQPLLDGLRIDTRKRYQAPAWRKIAFEIKLFLLSGWFGELIFTAEVAKFIKPGGLAK